MAVTVRYYDEKARSRTWACPCGWRGTIGEMATGRYTELQDGSCPACDTMLVIIPYPTLAETRRAAARGNREAIDELSSAEAWASRAERAAALELRSPEQLPSLELATPTRFVWDQVAKAGEQWVEIRVAGSGDLVWRQLAYWEGYEQLNRAREALRTRYGAAFVDLAVTDRSEMYLYGDVMSGPSRAGDPDTATAADAPWVG